MANGTSALSVARLKRQWTAGSGVTPFLPKWSKVSAMRAVRAVVVIPSLFAITDQVIGNVQMATFAAFGGFATLVLASFAGTRRDKLVAHLVLALAGSVLLTIGTAVSSSAVLAALVTLPVTFAVFFAGIAGPNAASGAIAAMLRLRAARRLARHDEHGPRPPRRLVDGFGRGHAGGPPVLASPGRRNNAREGAVASCAGALADQLDAALGGDRRRRTLERAIAAKHELLAPFTSTPFRPTGLAAPDQAMANASSCSSGARR